jgi:hypothetical protein
VKRFISRLAPEDRCHLNGLAMQNGAEIRYRGSRCDVVEAGASGVTKAAS